MTNISLRLTRSQFKAFLKIEAVCVLALCIAAVVSAGLLYFQTMIVEKALFSPIQAAESALFYVIYFGIVPTVLLGAPIYGLLKAYARDSWAAVLFTGLAPGFVILFFSWSVGVYAIVCGGIIASITHAYCRNVKCEHG
jgi:hypothetical protein